MGGFPEADANLNTSEIKDNRDAYDKGETATTCVELIARCSSILQVLSSKLVGG